MKKPSRCVIALALILGGLLFFEIKDTMTGKKDIFIARWFSWLFFSNSGYAKKIEVKPYLLNDEQVIHLLANPQQEIQQPPQKDLYLKNVNLVLRISNHGGASAWGILAYRIYEDGKWFRLEIDISSSKREINKKMYDYVIPVGIAVPFDNDKPPEHIQYKWVSLYTKF